MPVTNISQAAPQGRFMNDQAEAARRGGKPGSGSSSGGGKPGGNADKSLGLTDHYYGDGQMPRAQPGGKPGMATNASMGAPLANKGMPTYNQNLAGAQPAQAQYGNASMTKGATGLPGAQPASATMIGQKMAPSSGLREYRSRGPLHLDTNDRLSGTNQTGNPVTLSMRDAYRRGSAPFRRPASDQAKPDQRTNTTNTM